MLIERILRTAQVMNEFQWSIFPWNTFILFGLALLGLPVFLYVLHSWGIVVGLLAAPVIVLVQIILYQLLLFGIFGFISLVLWIRGDLEEKQ